MKLVIRNYCVTLVVMILMIFCVDETRGSWFGGKRIRVSLSNGLSSNLGLWVDCQSANHDVGERTLNPNEQIEWSFKEYFFSSYYYWCYASYTVNGVRRSKWFDIYKSLDLSVPRGDTNNWRAFDICIAYFYNGAWSCVYSYDQNRV